MAQMFGKEGWIKGFKRFPSLTFIQGFYPLQSNFTIFLVFTIYSNLN